MSNKLPIPGRKDSQSRALALPGRPDAASSAIARLAVSLAPDILRAAERALLQRDAQPAQRREHAQTVHGQSVSMSEVVIDTTLPFVRRVTVRNASSWSNTPLPLPTVEGKHGRGRLIGVSSAIIVLVAVMARKVMPGGKIIDIQGKQRD